ncbi:hypothetical protein DFH11DRAFT_1758726 [Phellopilus nigrolimitatus]|nr:hypothetical protein DFH11DRAFT_1758726 [Phellopilus nigrolimitatus]
MDITIILGHGKLPICVLFSQSRESQVPLVAVTPNLGVYTTYAKSHLTDTFLVIRENLKTFRRVSRWDLRFALPIAKLTPSVAELDTSKFGACAQLRYMSLQTASAGRFRDEYVRSGHVGGLPFDKCLPPGIAERDFGKWHTGLGTGLWSMTGGSLAVPWLRQFIVQYGHRKVHVSFYFRVPLRTPRSSITFNYRLGPSDFLKGLRLNKEVTVFGRNAGSIAIVQLLLGPIFCIARAAILESGLVASVTLTNASRNWQRFASALSECAASVAPFGYLRSASFEVVNTSNVALSVIQGEFSFLPVIDGPGGIIHDLLSKFFTSGHFARIPFIAGTKLDEGNHRELGNGYFVHFADVQLIRATRGSPQIRLTVLPPAEYHAVLNSLMDIYSDAHLRTSSVQCNVAFKPSILKGHKRRASMTVISLQLGEKCIGKRWIRYTPNIEALKEREIEDDT